MKQHWWRVRRSAFPFEQNRMALSTRKPPSAAHRQPSLPVRGHDEVISKGERCCKSSYSILPLFPRRKILEKINIQWFYFKLNALFWLMFKVYISAYLTHNISLNRAIESLDFLQHVHMIKSPKISHLYCHLFFQTNFRKFLLFLELSSVCSLHGFIFLCLHRCAKWMDCLIIKYFWIFFMQFLLRRSGEVWCVGVRSYCCFVYNNKVIAENPSVLPYSCIFFSKSRCL